MAGKNCDDVNALRYALFCVKKGKIKSYQLPPCKDSLKKHIHRANYQAYIWRSCFEQFPRIPEPEHYGWFYKNETLSIDWMDGKPAPDAVLDLLSCVCKRKCVPNDCICITNGMKCTDMCKLPNCENRIDEDENYEEEESAESDSDIDEVEDL